ncbi:MAG: AMP-binding protein, partial [Cyclobacteriaceae bacterium]
MQQPWFDHYPVGIPHTIDEEEYGSLSELFEDGFKKYSELPAFENMGKVITYKELNELSMAFASYLTNVAGLKKGDRLAIQMPNLLQYPVAMFGALRAGIVVVNTNPLYTPHEMEHQFKDSGATAIVILANFASHLEEIIENTDIKTVIVTEIGDLVGGLKGTIVNLAVKYVKKMVPKYHLPQALSFKKALSEGAKTHASLPELTGEDIAFLQYTGGTT